MLKELANDCWSHVPVQSGGGVSTLKAVGEQEPLLLVKWVLYRRKTQ